MHGLHSIAPLNSQRTCLDGRDRPFVFFQARFHSLRLRSDSPHPNTPILTAADHGVCCAITRDRRNATRVRIVDHKVEFSALKKVTQHRTKVTHKGDVKYLWFERTNFTIAPTYDKTHAVALDAIKLGGVSW